MDRIAVLINNKDRPTELALLIQSLRTQTYQNFDIFILDDCSGTPLNNYYFLNMLFTRIQLEGIKLFVKRTDFNYGVSRARQEIVDIAMEKGYNLLLRVDDDCILEPDYIERLVKVINAGYDIATGVTVPFTPTLKRDPIFLKGIVNRVILDEEGKFIMNGDDCGIPYSYNPEILPAHHFRSCALMKREVHEKIKYYPTKLSMNGFREEEIFSFKALIDGFKIGVDTNAANYHLMTPSGGERNTMNLVPFNQNVLEEYTKENKEKLNKIFTKENYPSKQELMKENNLLMK